MALHVTVSTLYLVSHATINFLRFFMIVLVQYFSYIYIISPLIYTLV